MLAVEVEVVASAQLVVASGGVVIVASGVIMAGVEASVGLQTRGVAVAAQPTNVIIRNLQAEAVWSSSSGYAQWGFMAIPQSAVRPVQLAVTAQ